MAKITSLSGIESPTFSWQYRNIDIESKKLETPSFSWKSYLCKDSSRECHRRRMESKHHITRLKQDIDAWNQWRKINGEPISLVRAQLQSAKLRRASLSSIDLSEANLKQADLRRAFMCDSRLIGADLSEADLSRASLTGADLRKANFTKASLKWACFIGADLRDTNLNGADLTGADLTDANLTGANLTGANLTGVDLTGASLVGTQAHNTNFQGAILTGACLENWKIDKTTQLSELICDYLYLQSGKNGRCPSSGSLSLGEITQLLQKILLPMEQFSKQETAN
ncbi:pentapeptide repeat-containing protein [Candidatus Gracilibacteria bacterium]|nr:pentapeptide repeat-containing protein [Candidatus Gracilibacteria bacterium]NJM86835.1 pentapeptide repeat-containing protein [Hydrococcus sp. RU_2_2]NJP17868.1 pentapeptide repeat-containing protein [Hydrococcus sp. CRU_1_1]NJQ97381.1 pentapeptide repeat-containing protein [Hydrococcus sp. CSU_1_8]